MQKQIGRKQKSKLFNDSDDVYDFEYKIPNAISLLERAEKITPEDKKKIWDFIELLKALRVRRGE